MGETIERGWAQPIAGNPHRQFMVKLTQNQIDLLSRLAEDQSVVASGPALPVCRQLEKKELVSVSRGVATLTNSGAELVDAMIFSTREDGHANFTLRVVTPAEVARWASVMGYGGDRERDDVRWLVSYAAARQDRSAPADDVMDAFIDEYLELIEIERKREIREAAERAAAQDAARAAARAAILEAPTEPWNAPNLDNLFAGTQVLSPSRKWSFLFSWGEHLDRVIGDAILVEVRPVELQGTRDAYVHTFEYFRDFWTGELPARLLPYDWPDDDADLYEAVRWEASHPKLAKKLFSIAEERFAAEVPHGEMTR